MENQSDLLALKQIEQQLLDNISDSDAVYLRRSLVIEASNLDESF